MFIVSKLSIVISYSAVSFSELGRRSPFASSIVGFPHHRASSQWLARVLSETRGPGVPCLHYDIPLHLSDRLH